MNALTAAQVIEVWERGWDRPPVEQALTLLAFACPDLSWDALAALGLGRRDSYLLELRELTLGPALAGFVRCPHCGERLEFTLNTTEVRSSGFHEAAEWQADTEFSCGGLTVRFRLPNSTDLAAAAAAGDRKPEEIRQLLAARCVTEITRGGAPAAVAELPEEVLETLAGRLAECDPAAEVLLDLSCTVCGKASEMIFDIASFFWAEMSALAERLLREVHALAGAYGWREQDILAMSAARRQFYLELVG